MDQPPKILEGGNQREKSCQGEIEGHFFLIWAFHGYYFQNIIDAAISTVAGAGGGIAGSAIGAFAGPVGIVVGGVAGGILGSTLAAALSDRLTQWLFDIPKDEALENAYRYLGVPPKASNSEVNK